MQEDFGKKLRDFILLLWHESWLSHGSLRQLWRSAHSEADLQRFWEVNSSKMRLPSLESAFCAAARTRHHYNTCGVHVLMEGDAGYPPQVLQSHRPPLLIVAKGDVGLLSQPQMAIVGSREVHGEARLSTQLITSAVLCLGYIPTSGGALGVDALVHRQAMQYQAPTILVAATGLDIQYPRANADIYEYCYERGAVLSLYPLGTKAQRERFPTRNTLIASLSQACIISQCRQNSGALYTARASNQLNREVFVAAGLAFNSLYAGGLGLVQSMQAKLLCSTSDIPRLEPPHYPAPWQRACPQLMELGAELGLGELAPAAAVRQSMNRPQNFPQQLELGCSKGVVPKRAYSQTEQAILSCLELKAQSLQSLHSLGEQFSDVSESILGLELDGIISLGQDWRYSLVR